MRRALSHTFVCYWFFVVSVVAQVNVTTWHNDIGRSGQNTQETVLTPGDVDQQTVGTVTTETFALLCRFTSVTGQIYAQPLAVSNSDRSMTIYVATMQDYVYAFQIPANWNGTCSQITTASANLLAGFSNEYPADACFVGDGTKQSTCDSRVICPSVGVLGTPVIDTSSNTLYLVAESQVGSTGTEGQSCGSKGLPTAWNHRVHALNLTTLAEKFGGPYVIQPSNLGEAIFSSRFLLQRPGLLWLNGNQTKSGKASVYLAFSMMDGTYPHPSGWVLGYYGDLSNESTPLEYATAAGSEDPQGWGGGIWQGGGGLAAGQEQNGNPYYIYFSTADGVFDNPQAQNGNAGDSFLKLTTDLTTVYDYFTPADQYYRWNNYCTGGGTSEGNDIDFGSSGVTLLPDGVPSQYPYLVVKSDKENYLWVMNRNNLGQFNGTGCVAGDPQACTATCGLSQNATVELPFLISTSSKHQDRSTGAFWSGSAPNSGDAGELYFAGSYDQVKRYPVRNTCPTGQGNPPICYAAASSNIDPNSSLPAVGYAATPSVSSNVTASGIVWVLSSVSSHPGLYALDAGSLSELYDSNSCFTNDQITPGKFSVPTVANGYVFVGTLTDFDIYGVIQPRSCQ